MSFFVHLLDIAVVVFHQQVVAEVAPFFHRVMSRPVGELGESLNSFLRWLGVDFQGLVVGKGHHFLIAALQFVLQLLDVADDTIII